MFMTRRSKRRHNRFPQMLIAASLVLSLAGLARSVDYELTWHTMDGGGGHSAGGGFSLSGTIGQHDAGPSTGAMSGGAYSLTGGFWPAAVLVCHCPGDMNGDGLKDGLDIQQFTACLIDGGACACADVDRANGVTLDDVAAFVVDLLAGDPCP